AHYKLNADIDLGVAPYNVGEGWEPIGVSGGSFEGSFDGNDHTISNLTINRPSTDYIGLFGVNKGKLINIKITKVNVVGKDNTGGLVGNNIENGQLINIESTDVNITGATFTGGLVGRNYHLVEN